MLTWGSSSDEQSAALLCSPRVPGYGACVSARPQVLTISVLKLIEWLRAADAPEPPPEALPRVLSPAELFQRHMLCTQPLTHHTSLSAPGAPPLQPRAYDAHGPLRAPSQEQEATRVDDGGGVRVPRGNWSMYEDREGKMGWITTGPEGCAASTRPPPPPPDLQRLRHRHHHRQLDPASPPPPSTSPPPPARGSVMAVVEEVAVVTGWRWRRRVEWRVARRGG